MMKIGAQLNTFPLKKHLTLKTSENETVDKKCVSFYFVFIIQLSFSETPKLVSK